MIWSIVMKLAQFILTIFFMLSAQFAIAKVTIKFESNVDVLAVNESKPEKEGGGLFSSSATITLPNGINQIVFRYNAYFDIASEVQSLRSEVIIARFEAYDTELEFKFPKFTDAEMAKENINPLNWSLVKSNGEKIEHFEDTLILSGLQLGRNFIAEAKQYNALDGIAAIKTPNQKSTAQVTNSKPQPDMQMPVNQTQTPQPEMQTPVNQTQMQKNDMVNVPNTPKNTAEEMLHFWYEKADENTKARFKEFINQQ